MVIACIGHRKAGLSAGPTQPSLPDCKNIMAISHERAAKCILDLFESSLIWVITLTNTFITEFIYKKIPHTGDTNSLDVCRY